MSNQAPPKNTKTKATIGAASGLTVVAGLAVVIATSSGLNGSQKPQGIQPVHKSTFNTNAPAVPGSDSARPLSEAERDASFILSMHTVKPETVNIQDSQAIQLGRSACSGFTAAATYPEMLAAIQSSDLPDALGAYLINVSVSVYCPEFSDLLPR